MSAEIVEDKSADAAPADGAKKKKKLIMIGGAAVAALALGGGGAAFFLGGSKTEATAAEAGHGGEEAASADHGGGDNAEEGHGEGSGEKFVDVPPLSVNLRSPDGAPRFLKLHFMLVPGPKGNETTLKDQLPMVLDAYQPFLRELRPEDLAGSAAVFRLKEELMVRATRVLGPGMVKDVLIQDLIQQ
ncbi:flagellar basal body-associated FliL family protein [Sphingomonas sp. RS6]